MGMRYVPLLLIYSLLTHSPCRNIFLGLALDKLNQNADSEKAYRSACHIKENDKTAWQGLIGLYQKQGSSKIDPYREVVLRLGKIYAEAYRLPLL